MRPLNSRPFEVSWQHIRTGKPAAALNAQTSSENSDWCPLRGEEMHVSMLRMKSKLRVCRQAQRAHPT